jgi:ribonucleoside-diphosphate reductase beta chain
MLTEVRHNLKPVEYPELLGYRDAVRHAYWLHSEFNLTEDVHDFRSRTTAAERQALERTMLAIAQVEVAVKTFWGDIYKRFPKPEVGAVGYTFAESEVRHQDAYAHLLDILGLQARFATLEREPAIGARLKLLRQHLATSPQASLAEYVFTLVLFSIFVEHVSLFGQFLIMKAFNRERNIFKGIANIVEATSKEEQIHGMFGYKLVEILRAEAPELFAGDFEARLQAACQEALAAEREILAWIFEAGELDFLPLAQIEAFIKARFNAGLSACGSAPIFALDQQALAATSWFDEEMVASKHVDFFHKRPTSYSKKTRAITADDLFAA